MRTFLSCLLGVVLAAVAVAGWVVWEENQRLRKDLQTLRSQIDQITAERDQERASLKKMTEAKESLGRNLVSTLRSLDETKESLAGLQEEKRRVDAELAAERRLAREKAEATAAQRAAEAERAVKAEEARKRREEDPLADVGTLKQLLDLTDKAPRRAAD